MTAPSPPGPDEAPSKGPSFEAPFVELNLTSCKGGFFVIPLAAELVRESVPEPYVPFASGSTALSFVMMWAFNCEKGSVRGVDVGAVHFATLYASIDNPEGGPKPRDGVITGYLLETWTQNGDFAKWFGERGVTSRVGEVVRNYEPHPDPSFYGQLDLTLSADGTTFYSVTGDPGKVPLDSYREEHLFFGPNPATDFMVTRTDFQRGTEGDALVQTSANTGLSEVMRGVPIAYGTSSWIETPSFTLRVAEPTDLM